MQLHSGENIERYEVVSVLGQGGVAIVYKVVHQTLRSEHALKLLLIPSEPVKERLLREGRAQASIRHPNLVSVTDVLEVNGAPGLVMEYVNGPALDQWLAKRKRPAIKEALGLFHGIVRGVAAAHRAGRIHRDLKPANVLLQEVHGSFIPKVTDFGLVKAIDIAPEAEETKSVTDVGHGMGTPQYMAPEQIRNAKDADQRADIFALGCILYELITNERAFQGPDNFSIFSRVVAGEYTAPEAIRPDCPDVVSSAIKRMLQVEPHQRPANCDVVLEMLYGAASKRRSWDFAVKVEATEPETDLGLTGDEPTPIIQRRDTIPVLPPLDEADEATPVLPGERKQGPGASNPTMEPALDPTEITTPVQAVQRDAAPVASSSRSWLVMGGAVLAFGVVVGIVVGFVVLQFL